MTGKAKLRLLARAFFASAAVALASPGEAAEGTAKPQDLVDVEVPAVFAPMVVEQRLESYAYITVLLSPAAADKIFIIREKMPFIRDAFLRELNKGTIVKAGDPKTVDETAIKARLLVRMNQILAAGTVANLKLEPIQYTAIRPQG